MNDVQLWIAAGLPTITVLVGILLNQNALSRVEKRVDSLESKLDLRIDSLESKLESRIDSLESKLERRIESQESKEESHYQSLTGDMRRFYQFVGEYSARTESLEHRVG